MFPQVYNVLHKYMPLQSRGINVIPANMGANFMSMNNPPSQGQLALFRRLESLKREHAGLKHQAEVLEHTPGSDQLQIQRLKKRKLQLKDMIKKIEAVLLPDIIA